MTIRRIERTTTSGVGAARASRGIAAPSGAFAEMLRSVDEVESPREASTVGPVTEREARRESLDQADTILAQLETLQEDLAGLGSGVSRERLQEARDEALRTLSEIPGQSGERELLLRTAVIATVELAKSSRGDYE